MPLGRARSSATSADRSASPHVVTMRGSVGALLIVHSTRVLSTEKMGLIEHMFDQAHLFRYYQSDGTDPKRGSRPRARPFVREQPVQRRAAHFRCGPYRGHRLPGVAHPAGERGLIGV